MKKSLLCVAAVMIMAGAAVGMFAKGWVAGRESRVCENGILTPAKDEELASLEGAGVTIMDEDVPLAGGPGILEGSVMTDAVQESPYIRQVVNLVNEERTKAGLMPLEKSDGISLAAAVRAEELTASFSHTRPDGSAYRTVLEQNGITYRSCGENVAYGYSTPEAVMDAWMDSDGHRENILNAGYTNIGVGYFKDNRGLGYWAQIFTVERPVP